MVALCSTSGRAAPSWASVSRRSGPLGQPRNGGWAGSAPRHVARASPADTPYILACGMVDYYEVLGVDDTADAAAIKSAYRALAKVCHPDFTGDSGHNMCILLNEAYAVLSDPGTRSLYNAELDRALEDEDDGYTGEPLSKWMPGSSPMAKNTDPAENRAVFVDEVTCIGCKQCVWCAPATFRIEPEHGRSRAFAQWLDNEEDLQAAIDACPVSCIHWVQRQELAALEFVVRTKVPRTGVAFMMAGQGAPPDVWAARDKYLKDRDRREAERRKAAQYSATAEAARRAAAQELMRQQMGWFADWADRLGISASISASVLGSTSMDDPWGYSSTSDDEYAAYKRVGRRRRARPQGAAPGTRNAGGGRVPDDRALVPVAVARQPWAR